MPVSAMAELRWVTPWTPTRSCCVWRPYRTNMRACASLPQIAAHLAGFLDHACNDALLLRPNRSKSKLHAQMKGLLSIGDSSPAENQPFLRDQGTWMTQRKHGSFTYRVVRSNAPRAHKQCACSQHHAGSRLALQATTALRVQCILPCMRVPMNSDVQRASPVSNVCR